MDSRPDKERVMFPIEAVRPVRVFAVVAPFHAQEPVRRDAVGETGRQLNRQLLLPLSLSLAGDFIVVSARARSTHAHPAEIDTARLS